MYKSPEFLNLNGLDLSLNCCNVNTASPERLFNALPSKVAEAYEPFGYIHLATGGCAPVGMCQHKNQLLVPSLCIDLTCAVQNFAAIGFQVSYFDGNSRVWSREAVRNEDHGPGQRVASVIFAIRSCVC